MTGFDITKYTAEEREAAMVLCQLRDSGLFYNESELETAATPSTSPSPAPESSPYATSTPSELQPGPSSAPNMEHSASDRYAAVGSPDKRKYKMSLFERYEREQRQWTLAAQNIRVTAGESVSTRFRKTTKVSRLSPAETKCQPSTSSSVAAPRSVVTPQRRRTVRRAVRRNVHAMLANNDDSEDSDTSHEALSEENGSEKVKIGNITVSSRLVQELSSMTANKATRKLLIEVFSRRVLATHSLTGRPSPAFPDKPVKKRLNPLMVQSIIDLVCQRCRDATERHVRMSITTKLADECKMQRYRLRNEA